MPRNAQAPQAPNGQAYGQKGEAIAAQQQIPLPQGQGPTMPAAQGQAGPQPGQPTQPVDLMQAAQQFDPGITPLTAPSQRPGEPVTTGLATGPGAGPEIFSQPSRASASADVLTALAQASGNDAFLDLASRIRQAGGMR